MLQTVILFDWTIQKKKKKEKRNDWTIRWNCKIPRLCRVSSDWCFLPSHFCQSDPVAWICPFDLSPSRMITAGFVEQSYGNVFKWNFDFLWSLGRDSRDIVSEKPCSDFKHTCMLTTNYKRETTIMDVIVSYRKVDVHVPIYYMEI